MTQEEPGAPRRGAGRRGPGGHGGGRGGGPRRGGGRGRRGGARRGDARLAALTLLAEEPMHGYQIMNELADRTNGVWQPSPGSIYPILQQLTDEGLVACEKSEGRKVFSLTSEGEQAVAELQSDTPVWEQFIGTDDRVDLRTEVGSLAAAAKQVGMIGTTEQAAKAAEIIVEARKRLYQLLAE